jgi:hypothetical protein
MKKSLILGVTSLGGGVNSIGHHYYANKIKEMADKSGSDHVVVVGHAVDGITAGKKSVVGKIWKKIEKPNLAKRKIEGAPKIPESPMPAGEKIKFAKAFSRGVNWAETTPERGLGEIFKDHAEKYSKIHVHVEPEQAKHLRETVRHMENSGELTPGKVKIHDFGRISNSSGEQITGTAMRHMIVDGEKEKFFSQLPPAPSTHPQIHQHLWNSLRYYMGISKTRPPSLSSESTIMSFKKFIQENSSL